MSIPTRLVLTRGDTRTITLTMDAGAGLDTAGVKLTARVGAEDDDAVWAKDQDDMATTDTTAAYTLTASDWDAWEAAGEPEGMVYDFEVTVGTVVTTQARGTIRVLWDVSR